MLLGAASAFAYLVRQTAILPTLTFVLFSLRRAPFGNLILFGAPLGAAALGHHYWLTQINGTPYFAQQPLLQWSRFVDPPAALGRIAQVVFGVGLQLTPVACCWIHRDAFASIWRNRRSRICSAAVAVGMAALLFAAGESAKPYGDDVVFDFGLGSDSTLPGRNDLHGTHWDWGSVRISLFRWSTTLLSVASTTLLAGCAFLPSQSLEWSADQRFWGRSLAAGFAALVGLCLVTTSFYERYLIPIVALGSLVALLKPGGDASPRPGLAAWTILAVFAVFSVVGMQDFKQRHATARSAIASLESQGVAVGQINGGFEFAGERKFNPHYRDQKTRVAPYLASVSEVTRTAHLTTLSPLYHYLDRRKYSISVIPLPGMTIEQRLAYRSWLREGEILILRRIE
jgi:hypothetical protein